MNAIDKLYKKAKEQSPVCVGLDTRVDYFPEYLANADLPLNEKLFEFNKKIIDATINEAGCYKVQVACYEAHGLSGMAAYSRTLKYIREKGAIVIADVKRGDIASTASEYARGHFTGDFEADFITINTYMGEDAISPYYPYLEEGKGIFALVKTSNKSGADIQNLISSGKPVYEHMAKLVSNWGKRFIGSSGFSSIGAVMGLTYPEEYEKVQSTMPSTFLLIPGYGAQGGTGRDIARFFNNGIRGAVNSSRGIISAHKGKDESESFADLAAQAVADMKEDILKWL